MTSIGSLSNINAYKAKKANSDPFVKERQLVELRKKMESYLERQAKYNSLIWCHSGLISDTDFIWVHAILNIQNKYPNKIKLHLHIPHETYMRDGVGRGLKTMLWVDFIDRANRVTHYTDNHDMTVKSVRDDMKKSRHTTPSEMVLEAINKKMIDSATVLIGVYDNLPVSKRAGSLRSALEYASTQKKDIVQYRPRTLS